MSFGQPPIISEAILTTTSLSRIDYGDEFSVTAPRSLSPEACLRKILGDTPDISQKFIWTGLLGFPLQTKRSSETIAGWSVTGRGHDWIRIENRSWFLSANIICRTNGGKLFIATLLKYEHWFGKWWWAPLAIIHRGIMPGLLRKGMARAVSRAKL